MNWTTAKKFKLGGMVILAIPILFLLIFLFGEVLGGDLEGLSHLLQVLPLLLLLWAAMRWPKVVGIILIVAGILLGAMYWRTVSFPLTTILVVEGALFLPMIVSGMLLFLGSRQEIKPVSESM